jgi:hypothetical protein
MLKGAERIRDARIHYSLMQFDKANLRENVD